MGRRNEMDNKSVHKSQSSVFSRLPIGTNIDDFIAVKNNGTWFTFIADQRMQHALLSWLLSCLSYISWTVNRINAKWRVSCKDWVTIFFLPNGRTFPISMKNLRPKHCRCFGKGDRKKRLMVLRVDEQGSSTAKRPLSEESSLLPMTWKRSLIQQKSWQTDKASHGNLSYMVSLTCPSHEPLRFSFPSRW